jgi:uncharacterized protein (TIGR01777 family)
MRVIIPGGTGLIGRALAADLVTAGYEVVLLSRNPARVSDLPAGVGVERWDGRTADGWGHLADGATAIVNLAGENLAGGRWTSERKQRIVRSRVDAGKAIVQAIKASVVKPGVVVQASGVGHYGPHGDEKLAETAPPGNDFGASVTLDWEASTAPIEALGVRRVILRSGVVLSTQGGALPRLMLPYRFFAGGPLGNGRQWFSWIHIADEVSAIRFLMEYPEASGPFNLSAPGATTNAEFGRALGRAMGRPSWIPVPAFAMRLLFGEMATVLLDGQQVVPERLLDLGFTFRFPQAEPALRDLLRK